MLASSATRVGIIVFIAAVALVLMVGFLRGWNLSRDSYPLTIIADNSLGMMKGDAVRMAGVPVGKVDTLGLRNGRAEMIAGINRKYRIPRNSTFVIRVGLLIGERYIEIVPNRQERRFIRPGATVVAQVPPRIEDLLPQTQELIGNLKDASASLKLLLADRSLQQDFRAAAKNIEQTAASLRRAVGTIERSVDRNQYAIDAVARNVTDTTASIRATAAEVQRFLARGDVQKDVAGTLQAARATVESLERAVTSLEKLVTAPEFQEDLRATVSGAREAVEQAKDAIGSFSRIFGGGGPKIRVRLPTRATNIDMLYRPDDGRFRTSLTVNVPTGKGKFLNLGIFDAGAGNKLILQPGVQLDEDTDLRYGLYASRLGVGLDRALSRTTFTSLDLYDPHEPTLNMLAGYRVSEDWSATLGVDSLFKENKVVLGAKFTK